MELAKITVVQVGILFILIILGFILQKCGVLEVSAKKSLSNLMVYAVAPCVIVSSYFTEFDSSVLHNLLIAFLISAIILLLSILISFLFTLWWKTDQRAIMRFASMFSNAVFMGLPLIQALFGSEGVIYAGAFVSMFNILVWTVGVAVLGTGNKPAKLALNIITSPSIIALVIGLVLYLCGVGAKVPEIIASPIELVAGMNTPLSMVLTGMIMATVSVKSSLKNLYMWLTVALRLIIIPAITLGIIVLINMLFTVDKLVLQATYLLGCCPCASITSAFAVRYGYSEDIAACAIVLSVAGSVVLLPVWSLIISAL